MNTRIHCRDFSIKSPQQTSMNTYLRYRISPRIVDISFSFRKINTYKARPIFPDETFGYFIASFLEKSLARAMP